VTELSHAVFLSYAAQDGDAAQRICGALRAAGIEVWLDTSELRGGDAWDHAIRRQIKACALFIPVISRNTHARIEGYFRLEWKLAVDRSHLIAPDQAFLLPVVIDDTPQDDERIPDRFRELQWTRLPAGETSPAFVERVRRLLSAVPADAPTTNGSARPLSATTPPVRQPIPAAWRTKWAKLATVALVLGVLGYFVIDKLWVSKYPASPPPPAAALAPAAPATFSPPPHSIAVLPFVNMSGDKEQEYFSDGLTEELLNSLTEINGLQVAARTSAFSFKGTNADIGTIAHKLNVGAVLEGSVRRSGNTVRITTQLINAVTGFHLWSHTYDRDLGDVLKLETDIAGAVASALKVSLLGDEATKIELGGTRSPAALDAYLRGRKAHVEYHDPKDLQTAIAAYAEAISLDPNYALAFANRSIALSDFASQATGTSIRDSFDKAQSDALRALALAPDLAEGHLALAYYLAAGSLDLTRASDEYERARALASGNARVLRDYAIFAALMGRSEPGIAAARRAVVLDPLSRDSHLMLGLVLYVRRQNAEAVTAFQDAIALDPEDPGTNMYRGLAYYALGDYQSARAACERTPDNSDSQACLALAYHKLDRQADAERMLAKDKASMGDADAYTYADIYTQWGNTPKALEWLETARRLRNPGMEWVKADPLLDPLRKEPRFQAIERELRFPD
jgi:TolB-like protein